MNNQEYSIYIAQDNVDEIIEGFSALYFAVKDATNISGHNFSVQNQKADEPALGDSSIILTSKNMRPIIKKALELKNNLLSEGQELSMHLGKGAYIVFIFSPS